MPEFYLGPRIRSDAIFGRDKERDLSDADMLGLTSATNP